jgi:O-antigen/teichoic acid export membrane protein
MKTLFAVRNLNVKQAGLVGYRAGSDLIGKGAFLLITIVAARRLPLAAFAVFSLGSTIGWVAAVATDFGIQLHLARAIARCPERAGCELRSWLTVRLWTSAAAVGGVAAVSWAVPGARPYASPVVLLTSVYVVGGLVEFLHYFYRGLSRTDLESTLTLAQRLVTLGLALVVLWLRPGVTLLAAAMLVPVAATFLYSVRLALSIAGPPAANAAPRAPIVAEWWRDVMPIAAGIVLSAVYFRVDIFLLELWSGAGAVARYNAVFRLVEALRLFPAAVLAVGLPALVRATSLKPLLQVSAVVTVPAVAVALAVAALGAWLVGFLYGSQYEAAVPAFRVLLIGFPLMSFNYALTHQLIGWNGHRAYAVICAAALAFNVGLNAVLIPSLSIVGAAWSTVWTEALLSAGCLGALWLRLARPGLEPAVAVEAS